MVRCSAVCHCGQGLHDPDQQALPQKCCALLGQGNACTAGERRELQLDTLRQTVNAGSDSSPRDQTSTRSSMVHLEATSNSSGARYGAVHMRSASSWTHETLLATGSTT